MASVSAVVITLNEESKLASCLESLKWADEVVVLDSFSSDNTVEVAKQYTDHVHQRAFDDFSGQKNAAVEKCTHDWVLSVDADEVVSPELQESIKSVVNGETEHDGYWVTRQNRIFGRYLKYGGQGPEKILRLFRKSKSKFVQPIHEYVDVQGEVGQVDGDLVHQSLNSLTDYVAKLEEYTSKEAAWLKKKGEKATFLKLYLMPLFRFLYCYIFRGGFLDGHAGFQFHALSSFYYYLKYAKLNELNGK